MARPVHPYFVPSAAQAAGVSDPFAGAVGRDYSRTLAGMLLAAAVAALLVVADQLIETWADGHLLAVWVALWSIAIAALAVMAPPLRQWSDAAADQLTRWSLARAERRADQAMWQVAQHDYRMVRELRLARTHSERDD